MDADTVMYGLRNLLTGDDEQTRIGDWTDDEWNEVPEPYRMAARTMLTIPDYNLAYIIALTPALRKMDYKQLLEAASAFAKDFTNEQDPEDRAQEHSNLCTALFEFGSESNERCLLMDHCHKEYCHVSSTK